jgi:hypothetical protein
MPTHTQRDNLTPDISVYADGNIPDADAKTDFFKRKLFIELKLAETSDPFRDPEDPLQPQAENFCFENASDVSLFNHGQLCSYAAAHVGSQFRVHTSTLPICGRSARFICWDRSGATVTRSFDYIKKPHILVDRRIRTYTEGCARTLRASKFGFCFPCEVILAMV